VPWRFEAKTSRVPSGENMGKPSNPSDQVMRSRPDPSTLTAHRSNSLPLPDASPWFDEKMIRSPDGNHEGAKDAAPRYVICCASVPSALATMISSLPGRTSPSARSFW
jgi:hypothetical protein